MNRTPALALSVVLIASGASVTVAPSYASGGTATASPAAHGAAAVVGHKHGKKHKKLRPPMRIKAGWRPGPGVGETTITWRKTKQRYRTKTTGFRIETSLTQFGPYGNGIPRKGRHWASFKVGKNKRKLVLTEKLLAEKVGAPLASANHVYFRVWSLDKKGRKVKDWTDGRLGVAQVRGMGPTGTGAAMTFASYNIRLAGKDIGTSHDWYQHRLPMVAQNIVDHAPGIVALQEAVPTAYDGHSQDTETQVLTLRNKVNQLSGTRYALVRSTYYAFIKKSQQGMRILYDTQRYRLLSDCPEITYPPGVNPEKTPNQYQSQNSSCAIKLPLLPGDSASLTRWSAYAHFADNATGQRFWVVSAHLDERATGSRSQQRRYEKLRSAQVETTLAAIDRLNTAGEPVILAGDLNTWQNSQAPKGDLAHDTLVARGFYDTAAALSRSGMQYATVNHFRPPKKVKGGVGPRYDVIMTKGIQGATTFENVIYRPGGQDASDHNMVVATFNLP